MNILKLLMISTSFSVVKTFMPALCRYWSHSRHYNNYNCKTQSELINRLNVSVRDIPYVTLNVPRRCFFIYLCINRSNTNFLIFVGVQKASYLLQKGVKFALAANKPSEYLKDGDLWCCRPCPFCKWQKGI